MLIIGITGTIGAGKGTLVDYLLNEYGFEHYSVRKYLTDILTKQGIEPNRDNFTILANKLRSENKSPSFLAEELYKQAFEKGKDAIIESIRTPGEVEKLKAIGEFYLIAVDADRQIRYHRIFDRKSETDNIGFEKFVTDEEREMESKDPNNQNLSACIQLANFTIINNGNIDEIHKQIDFIINQIKNNNTNGKTC